MRFAVLVLLAGCDRGAPGTKDGTEHGASAVLPTGSTDPGTGGTTPPADRYHPADWSDPGVHGTAAKQQDELCTACHGADLAGGTSGVSCDGCHAAGWRTDCTFCHGGVANATGAPPENIDDSTDEVALARFPAHTVHVEETIHAPFACEECHARPADVLTPGHVLAGDATPGEAEVAIARGGTWSAGTCSGLTCHGDGLGPNGTADASFVSACDACHADWTGGGAGLSGRHEKHVGGEGFDCVECHPATVDAAHAIVGPAVHVDGVATVDPAGTIAWDAADGTCTGECHGESHGARSWW